jgi:luciferase family oxidoreductase group 1
LGAPFALSVLDNAHTAVGQTSEEAFTEVIALARCAERRGYRWFWLPSTYAMPGAATSSPQLMLARLTGETDRIRLGAGGVMLPNHALLVIAEQFRMLDAPRSGRIDLGLGRAPGTDLPTAMALRRHHDANDGFPQQVLELLGFLGDDFPEGQPYRNVHALPGPWQAEQNRVPRPETAPRGLDPGRIAVLGSPGRPTRASLRLRSAR